MYEYVVYKGIYKIYLKMIVCFCKTPICIAKNSFKLWF